ncbi:MAG TPA: hypothetical protein VJ858_07100 [Acidimicrobiia bacterium]|nr:hypothetical protein [Acidimicrobiia bacterium]
MAVLAVVGFAAFGTSDDPAVESQAEAAAASMGHTAGGYAGLDFALGGDAATAAVAVAAAPDAGEVEPASEQKGDADEDASVGTIASPGSDWLSEVEVRALVTTYFQPQDVNRAVRIAWCETRFDPNAVDPASGGVGLFNHLPQYWEARAANAGFAGAAATDPVASTAAAAWEVYNGAGWEIFTCR